MPKSKSPLGDIHTEWVRNGKVADIEKAAVQLKEFLKSITDAGICHSAANKRQTTCNCLKEWQPHFDAEAFDVVDALIEFGCQKKVDQQKEVMIQMKRAAVESKGKDRVGKLRCYVLPGSPSKHEICLGTYGKLIDFGYSKIKTVQKCVGSDTPPVHGLKGRESNRKNQEIEDALHKHFVKLMEIAVPRSSRLAATSKKKDNDPELMELPINMSIRRCYRIFCEERGWQVLFDIRNNVLERKELDKGNSKPILSYSAYFYFWKKNYNNLVIQIPIRYALVDLSGTIHIKDQAIPGAVTAIQRLIDGLGRRNVLFLTDTTTISQSTLCNELQKLEFTCIDRKDTIMTSAAAVTQYVEQHDLNPYCLVEPDLRQDLPFVSDQPNQDYDSVLVGLSPSNFHYETLDKSFQILKKYSKSKDPDDPHRLLCFHRSKHIKNTDGGLSLGPGGFVTCLEHTADVKAHVFGKPSEGFYQAALTRLIGGKGLWEESVQRTVMIGDNIDNDIIGAQQAGIGTQILVKTGNYQPGDEDKCQSDVNDTKSSFCVMPSIVEAVDYILENNNTDNLW